MVFMWKHMCHQSYNDGKINHSSRAICTENVETQYCEKRITAERKTVGDETFN